MRVVAYSIKSADKEPLALANHKRHEITLISNSLTAETVFYAKGKEAVIVYTGDDVSALVINQLADLGVKYIATRSTATSHIDHIAAGIRQLKIANVPQSALTDLDEEALPMALAIETIHNLDKWQERKCLGDACVCAKACDQAKSDPLNHDHGQ
ncbi:Rossmann-fold NAD(P)-binding domain-containing protein [Pedobacter psychroterrae]|uniref:Lactate dehydrogenase n=1 Tax=Pedobacter psychroterrae TaxID=2530453 RepID=A0A4R0NK76_9SPHI|nr:lactate dehydrogenase [Pedobacter psychroterrae]TCD01111.1 lactate dehydrogenase [Pedobacter psychroterrae]